MRYLLYGVNIMNLALGIKKNREHGQSCIEEDNECQLSSSNLPLTHTKNCNSL